MLGDGGPVFYRQARVGRGGRRFHSWKFRSMIPESDARFGPRQAAAADARVTRVGRLLRATAMDELPQLWSILRGDMSFVGPRALMPEEIEVGGTGAAVPIEKIAPSRRARPDRAGADLR
jgi:lipopolysaccharide/colanic/teichoic acid biosynthesis glycosyltransferase